MALIQLGSSSNTITDAIGNNSITSALGFSSGHSTPLGFLTRFSKQSIFTPSSLPYVIRTNKNFDVIFHWFPKSSQIRTYFSQAFGQSDTDELAMFIRSIKIPDIQNEQPNKVGMDFDAHFNGAISGRGVNGSGDLTMDILSTEFSLVDHCFYQWLRETESPFWIYGLSSLNGTDSSLKDISSTFQNLIGTFDAKTEFDESFQQQKLNQNSSLSTLKSVSNSLLSLSSVTEITAFTKADIEIKYYSANMKELHSVWIYGAFPYKIETMDVDHKGEFAESHKVYFTYDSVDIVSPFVASNDSWGSVIQQKVDVGGKWTSGIQEDVITNYANIWLSRASRKVNKITSTTGSKLNEKLLNFQKRLTPEW